MKVKAKMIKLVNDCAERGIALVQKYNASPLTKDESQLQYLLRLVSKHRKDMSMPSKNALNMRDV